MYIYYDPKEDNRIRAIYSGVPVTKVWEEKGYELIEIPSGEALSLTREDSLEIEDNKVKKVNRKTHPAKIEKEPELPKFKDLSLEEKDNLIEELLRQLGKIQ